MTDAKIANWHKAVIERDGHCMLCKRYQGMPMYLSGHHLIPRRYQASRYDVRNGIALCADCHTMGKDAVHRKPESGEIRCVIALISTGVWDSIETFDEYKRRIRQ